MSASDRRITLMVLVDALRPDYLMHAPWLRKLAAQSATGFFREGFGFVPRQAYFGGLSTAEYGFTNMYCHDPEASPFASAWSVSDGRLAGAEQPGARRFVEQRARDHLTRFAQDYFSTYQIPLAGLPHFDLVEKRAPWDPRVGYRSLFHILDEKNIPWIQWMWPDTNRLDDHTDAGITRRLLADLRPEHRLACVHLQQLDGTGHAHGPNSAELAKVMIETDRLLREMVETLRARYDAVDVVIFGDHGMVSVTRPLDLQPALDATGLVFGVDYVHFLDSSMARFWFYHADARARIEAALDRVAGGHVLRGEELARHGLDACDPRNGELYFLADPGVLIFPNFFQQSGDPIPGMHGYDPDCPDNLGYFLWHNAARPERAGTTLGKVDPHFLFPILLDAVGLEPADFISHVVPAPSTVAAAPRRFTRHPDAAAEAAVAAHLARIEEAVRQRVGDIDALVLTGSFGRGEGGVVRAADGRYVPVNDYDVLIVSDRDLSAPLAGLGDELARELGVDYVDLNVIGNHWEHLPLTIYTYDLKYGSQVLAGDPALLDRIPTFASADLPVFELVRLLLNRTAGLLSGLRGAWLGDARPTADEQRYLTNQVAKTLMALGDWHLFRWKGFDSSYTRRRERFAALAPGAGLDPDVIAAICAAYDFKLHPDHARFAEGLADVRRLFPELESALCDSIALLAGRPCKTLPDAMAAYRAALEADAATVITDNRACAGHPGLAGKLAAQPPPGQSLRHSIYAALPLMLQAAVENSRDSIRQAQSLLRPTFTPPMPGTLSPAEWETQRDFVVKCWFAVCH